MSKTIDELIMFDREQHDINCGVTITRNAGNCDCNKSELKQALLQALMEIKPTTYPSNTSDGAREKIDRVIDQYSSAIKELFKEDK